MELTNNVVWIHTWCSPSVHCRFFRLCRLYSGCAFSLLFPTVIVVCQFMSFVEFGVQFFFFFLRINKSSTRPIFSWNPEFKTYNSKQKDHKYLKNNIGLHRNIVADSFHKGSNTTSNICKSWFNLYIGTSHLSFFFFLFLTGKQKKKERKSLEKEIQNTYIFHIKNDI